MPETIAIRDSTAADTVALENLYPAAFPDEDLLPLLQELLAIGPVVLSLVALADGVVVGHVAFTLCGIAGTADRPALLGPLAVAPGWQRRGIGTALVRDGLRRLREIGATQVLVLGDPAYYGRFGFRPESGVIPPGPVPPQWREAWQSLALGDGAVGRGRLDVPPPWRRPELWTP